jgi:hypothetical protein
MITETKTDEQMGIENVVVPVAKLSNTIIERGITVDRIAGIFLDYSDDMVHLAVVSGTIDVATKGNLLITGKSLPALMTWTKIEGAYAFEIDARGEKINLDKWHKVINQLAVLKNRYGHQVTTFFGAGYGTRIVDQFVTMDGKTFWFTKDGPKITGLRYDEKNGYLYGIALNQKSVGTQIVAVKTSDFLMDPAVLHDISKWQVVETNIEPAIVNFSRIRFVDSNVTFVVNHPENLRRQLTMKFVNGVLMTEWSDIYHTPYTVIGTVTSYDDLFVGYRQGSAGIEIFLQDRTTAPKQLPLYVI